MGNMVMKHVDWNKEYPEVPDLVHRSVLSALSELEEQEAPRMKKTTKKRIFLLAAALVALAGTTAAAAGVFSWNERAGQVFQADEETKNELSMNQMAQEVSQTVTDQGITITAIQTIQDQNRFYALFEVTAEDPGQKITEDCSMDYTMDFAEEESPFCALGWGFVSEGDQAVTNTRYFEIYGTKTTQSEENLSMNLQFTALRGEPAQKAGEGEVLVSGTWDFALDVHSSDMITHELDKDCQLGAYTVHVKSVALSPLSMIIVYDGSDVRAMEADQQVSLDQLDELRELYATGVSYADGTKVDEGVMIPLREGFREGEASYELLFSFDQVVDPDQVTAVLLGESRIEF